jgi:hypothetical protein
MTDINSFGVITLFLLLLAYSIYIFYKKIVQSYGSLRDTESIHRAILVIGGILVGIGFGGQAELPGDTGYSATETYLGILLTFAGLVLIVMGSFYLRSSLWVPLEEISEYSAEFGESFIATRLPITGGYELQRFSERFNENIIKLANKVSSFEIQMEYLESGVKQTVNAGIDVSQQSGLLTDHIHNYTSLSKQQNINISDIEAQLSSFMDWYNETQIALSEQFIELRAIAELGNLLAINAAIEAANLEVTNPGFETIASKLHELAKSLEEKQEILRLVIEDINVKYNELNRNVTNRLQESLDISNKASLMAEQVEENLSILKRNEDGLADKSNQLVGVLTQVNQNIPQSY